MSKSPNTSNQQNKLKSENPTKASALIGIERSFSGPIPPPEIIEHYNNINPKFAETIFNMAEKAIQLKEKELDFENENIKILIENNLKITKSGQNFAFCLVVLSIVGAVISAYLHESTVACSFIGVGFSTIITGFLINKIPFEKKQKKENVAHFTNTDQ